MANGIGRSKNTVDPFVPLLIPTLAFASGIAGSTLILNRFVGAKEQEIYILGVSLIFLAGIVRLLAATGTPSELFRKRRLHHVWLFLLFLGGGALDTAFTLPCQINDSELSNIRYVYGVVTDKRTSANGDVLNIDVNYRIDNLGHSRKVRNLKAVIICPATEGNIDDILLVAAGNISRRSTPVNTFESGEIQASRTSDEPYRIYCLEDEIIVNGHKASVAGFSKKFRNIIERKIELSGLETGTKNFLITLMMGNREYLHPDVRKIFSDTGMAHIIALSGMHVAIIGGIILFLLFPVNFAGLYRWRLVITLLLLIGFGFLTGWAYSTVRSIIMIGCITTAVILQRKNSAWNALLLATLVILAIWPSALYDVGLQLSFLCVASLIFFTSQLNPFDHRRHPAAYKIAGAVLATLVTTGITWIVSGANFGMFPFAFLLANLPILPFLPAYVVIAICSIIFSSVPFVGKALSFATDKGYHAMIDYLSFLNEPTTAIPVKVSYISVALWLAAAILMALWLNGYRNKIMPWVAGGFACTAIITIIFPLNIDSDFKEREALICNYHYKTSIKIREGNKEREYVFPSGMNTVIEIAEKRFMFLDAKIDQLSFSTPDSPPDYVIISRGCDQAPKELRRQNIIGENTVVAIHPMVARQKEAEWLNNDNASTVKMHSLRQSPILIGL